MGASQTGNTETCAGYIAEAAGLEAEDVGDYGAEDLAGFDGLIVGCPTWNTGADEYRSGTAWDDLIDEIKDVDLSLLAMWILPPIRTVSPRARRPGSSSGARSMR